MRTQDAVTLRLTGVTDREVVYIVNLLQVVWKGEAHRIELTKDVSTSEEGKQRDISPCRARC